MTRFSFKEQLVLFKRGDRIQKHLDRLIEAPGIEQIWRKIAVGSNYQLRPREFISRVLNLARNAESSVEDNIKFKRRQREVLKNQRKRVISIARAAKTELDLHRQLEGFLREPKCVIEISPAKGVKLDTTRRVFMHDLSHYLHGQCRGKWLDPVVVYLTEILFECSMSIDDVRRASGRRERMEREELTILLGQFNEWPKTGESGSSR
jgi:hypothetical protein